MVTRSNHVWDACRLSSLLFWGPTDYLPEGIACSHFCILRCQGNTYLAFSSCNTCRALHSVFIHANNLAVILVHQIVNWRACLKFPEEPKLSDEARDLICRLLCDVENRLGTRGVDEIKVVIRYTMWISHSFHYFFLMISIHPPRNMEFVAHCLLKKILHPSLSIYSLHQLVKWSYLSCYCSIRLIHGLKAFSGTSCMRWKLPTSLSSMEIWTLKILTSLMMWVLLVLSLL